MTLHCKDNLEFLYKRFSTVINHDVTVHTLMALLQVDACDSEGIVMAVSIWVRKLNCKTEPRCLVVMEPVERTVAMVTFNNQVCFYKETKFLFLQNDNGFSKGDNGSIKENEIKTNF